MATPNFQAEVSVEHPVEPPLKQAGGSCASELEICNNLEILTGKNGLVLKATLCASY